MLSCLAESASSPRFCDRGDCTPSALAEQFHSALPLSIPGGCFAQTGRHGIQVHRLRSKECRGSTPLLHRADVESFDETGRAQQGQLSAHCLWSAMDRGCRCGVPRRATCGGIRALSEVRFWCGIRDAPSQMTGQGLQHPGGAASDGGAARRPPRRVAKSPDTLVAETIVTMKRRP
jgi:hypothetical protein